MSAGRILVVDDLPDVRTTVSGLLSDMGFLVRSACSRGEALQLLKSEPFDVAILDVRLDDSDEDNRSGLVLMHDIQHQWPSTVVIILTGYADVEMVREALQPGRDGTAPAFGFVQKSELELLPQHVKVAMEHAVHKRTTPLEQMIAQGENEHQEFKSSLRWDYQAGRVNKVLGQMVTEAIAGMMNGQGGTLLIGVADDGKVLGIEKDLSTLQKPTLDGFQLALMDIVKTYIEVEHLPLLKARFEPIRGRYVCVVGIERSPQPVFFDTGDAHTFLLRVGNSTRNLDAKATVNYTQSHWSSNN